MVNKKATSQTRFIEGTLRDLDTIYNMPVEKIGITPAKLLETKRFHSLLFYEDKTDLTLVEPIFIKIKNAFNNVYKSYLKH